MFDVDKWQEIWFTVNKNKLRSLVTAFNVAWGIFILIILLGFGSGFQNGVKNQFADDAVNAIFIWSGETSEPYKGLKPGRSIKFTNDDYHAIRDKVKGVEYLSGRYWVTGEFFVRNEDKVSSFNIRAVHPDYMFIEKVTIAEGRYINYKDLAESRKVAVIGSNVAKILFEKTDPIDKYISINKIKYKIVGVFTDSESEREAKVIYIPITTAQLAYGGGKRLHQLMLTTGDASPAESMRIQADVMTVLRENHKVSPSDRKAIESFNVLEEYSRWMGVFLGIRIFLGAVGIMTLIAGIVGVSNIMLIVVKERTREIGVRKALGATPNSIVGLFLMEALAITFLAGYLGMVMGMFFLQSGALTKMMLSFGFPMEFFIDPHVDLGSAVAATVILALSGTLAGYFPARGAAKIQPIEALREE